MEFLKSRVPLLELACLHFQRLLFVAVRLILDHDVLPDLSDRICILVSRHTPPGHKGREFQWGESLKLNGAQ